LTKYERFQRRAGVLVTKEKIRERVPLAARSSSRAFA